MRIDLAQAPVERSDDFEETEFYIPTSANHKLAELVVKNLYESQIRFVVELVANAYDAAPGAAPIIHWPSRLEPWFTVTDTGPGMSPEFMRTQYAQIFSSTKDQSNDAIGGWGMGRLSALAIADSYTVISDDGNVRNTYSVFRGENGMPRIALLASGASTGPGVTVQVPIPNDKIDLIRREGSKLLPFFKPAPISNMAITPVEIIFKSPNGVWAIRDRHEEFKSSYVVMGGYPYPIDASQLPYGSTGRDVFQNFDRFVVTMPIGSCEVTSNRERLRYTDKTKDAIEQVARMVEIEFFMAIKDVVEKAPTYYDAVLEYAMATHGLPYKLSSTLKGKLKFEGKVIDDSIDVDGKGVKEFLNWGTGRRSNRYDKPARPSWSRDNCYAFYPWEGERKQPSQVVLIDQELKRILPRISHHFPVGTRVYAVRTQEALDAMGNPPFTKLSDMAEPPKDIQSRSSGPRVKVKIYDYETRRWEDEHSWDIKEGGVYVDFTNGDAHDDHLVRSVRQHAEFRPDVIIGIPRSSFKSREGYITLRQHLENVIKQKATRKLRNKLARINAHKSSMNAHQHIIKMMKPYAKQFPQINYILQTEKMMQDKELMDRYNFFSLMQQYTLFKFDAPKVSISGLIDAAKASKPLLFEVVTSIPNPSQELIECVS